MCLTYSCSLDQSHQLVSEISWKSYWPCKHKNCKNLEAQNLHLWFYWDCSHNVQDNCNTFILSYSQHNSSTASIILYSQHPLPLSAIPVSIESFLILLHEPLLVQKNWKLRNMLFKKSVFQQKYTIHAKTPDNVSKVHLCQTKTPACCRKSQISQRSISLYISQTWTQLPHTFVQTLCTG